MKKSLYITILQAAILIFWSCTNEDAPNGGIPFMISPDTLWTKTYGGSGFEDGHCRPTSDGGFIVLGRTESSETDCDAWVIKTDENGDSIWSQTYGGSDYDWGYSICQTTDNGYIFTGSTSSYGAGERDLWLIKTDANGILLWEKTYGGIYEDIGYCVQQTADNGFIVTGCLGLSQTDVAVWLIKTDESGDSIWSKTFNGNSYDVGMSVRETSDQGYIICGYTGSFGVGESDIWLIKTNEMGDSLWSQTYGGVNSDIGICIQETSDGGYIIIGHTGSFFDLCDVYLLKTDSSGNIEWDRTFGENDSNLGTDIQQTLDGGYIFCGHTGEAFGIWDVYIIKVAAAKRTRV